MHLVQIISQKWCKRARLVNVLDALLCRDNPSSKEKDDTNRLHVASAPHSLATTSYEPGWLWLVVFLFNVENALTL